MFAYRHRTTLKHLPLSLANLLLAALFGISCCVNYPALGEMNPKQLGLIKHGEYLIFTEELQFQKNIAQLPDVEKQIVSIRQQLELAISTNAAQWKQQQQVVAAIDRMAGYLKNKRVGTDEEKKLALEIRQLKKTALGQSAAVVPEELSGKPHVRELLIELTHQLQQLGLAITSLNQSLQELDQRYQATMSSLNQAEKYKIGPTVSFERRQKLLDRYEKIAFAQQVPVYLQNGKIRLGVIINKISPVMMSWSSKDDILLIPSSMAQSCGINLRGLQVQKITLPDGKKVSAKLAKLEQIRVGAVVAKNVAVAILPPESEHLGAIITLKTFKHYTPEFQHEKLQLIWNAKKQQSRSN
ncbi:MAG: hypothetical protein COA78_07435 [Blastopirellula sp.]|nr:MAG: hypothetical protein COA78_07435 [Blastopirellula sp.]